MTKIIAVILFLTILTAPLAAQDKSIPATEAIPANFKSDGCSMFPDGCYRDCCVEHDLAYFAGGKWRERWRADGRLLRCVAKNKGWTPKIIAPVMWAGVRLGGAPFLPTSFRWGFGKKKRTAGLPKTQQDLK